MTKKFTCGLGNLTRNGISVGDFTHDTITFLGDKNLSKNNLDEIKEIFDSEYNNEYESEYNDEYNNEYIIEANKVFIKRLGPFDPIFCHFF